MILPKQTAPVYSLKIPSTGKKLKYRPFLVKEEKALLLAEQSEDLTFMVDTLKQVVANCTMNSIDVNSLAIFDLEYILTKLRAKSVGEIADITVPCAHCKTKFPMKVDVSTLEVTKNPEHNKKIPLFDKVGVVMKYPKIDILNELSKIEDRNPEATFDAAVECIEYIYDEEKIFHAKDLQREQLVAFVDDLNAEQFGRIEKFFETMPRLEVKIEFKCPSCQKDNVRILEGIQNFF